MCQYILRFWFDHGGICIWGMNDLAKEQFGYAIDINLLPLSDNLVDQLHYLQVEYTTYIDLEYPMNPTTWTENHKSNFYERASIICGEMQEELGPKFKIINDVLKNIT